MLHIRILQYDMYVQCGAPKIAKLVYNYIQYLGFLVDSCNKS